MSPQGYGSPPSPAVQLGPPPPSPEDARFVVSFDPHSPFEECGKTQFFKVRVARLSAANLTGNQGCYPVFRDHALDVTPSGGSCQPFIFSSFPSRGPSPFS